MSCLEECIKSWRHGCVFHNVNQETPSSLLNMGDLKGTATQMINMLYMKELYDSWILIPVAYKSVEKYGSCGRLNIFKWTLMEAAIL